MNIYKLIYKTDASALSDLVKHGIYKKENNKYVLCNPNSAVVRVGLIEKTPAVINSDGDTTTPATFYSEIAYDVMTEKTIKFKKSNIANVTNPKHKFAGIQN